MRISGDGLVESMASNEGNLTLCFLCLTGAISFLKKKSRNLHGKLNPCFV